MASVVLARLTRARSVVHLHVVYSSWMGRGLRWAIRSADARIAVSQFVADSVTSGGITGPTHVALNAIDPEGWVPGEGRTEARSELGLPESAKVVITVCRLFEEKGVARLIRAFAASRGSVDDARLLIVGHDPAGGAYLDHLRDVVDDCGAGDAVVFLGRRPDVARLMAAADVFAMPSYEEPFGLVFAEAMAMQLPVVALDNGGTARWSEMARTGCCRGRATILRSPSTFGCCSSNPSCERVWDQPGDATSMSASAPNAWQPMLPTRSDW